MLFENKVIVVICIFMGLLTGCDKGIYTEQIGSSDFYLKDWGDNRSFVVLINSQELIVIPNYVLGYQEYGDYAIVARQIARDFECADLTVATIYEKRIEYWILMFDESKAVNLGDNNVAIPVSDSLLAKAKKTLSGLKLIEYPSKLTKCEDAREM